MNFQYDNKQKQDVDTVDNDILYRKVANMLTNYDYSWLLFIIIIFANMLYVLN